MMLRIEDTDRSRYVPGCEEEIIESLVWIGAEYQEGPDKGGPFGPYRQSERATQGVYDDAVNQLLESGHAYWAFDTPEELSAMRDAQAANKEQHGYFGGIWRDATQVQVDEARSKGLPGVVRLKMPREGKIILQDAIRGEVEFEASTCDDTVLLKADGMPTYHLAAMVDDHLMETTHIIRGEEWINSAPKHVFLFQALGWEPPVFVHVPVIKGKDGAKLSKRHGDTRCLDFRDAGFLPEALANFIALIGWSPGGDKEVMSMDEMASLFDLQGLQPSPGVFDIDKLKWMNGQYIRALDETTLGARVLDFASAPETQIYWQQHDPEVAESLGLLASADRAYAVSTISLLRERVETFADFGPATKFFHVDQPEMDDKAKEKWLGEAHVPELIAFLRSALESGTDPMSKDECESLIRSYAEQSGLEKLGPVVHPTRVLLTGSTTGPGLFELMSLLGRERMLARLKL